MCEECKSCNGEMVGERWPEGDGRRFWCGECKHITQLDELKNGKRTD